jgi:hypothetical protein
VLGELGYRPQVMADRILRVVTTLEFLQHKRVTGISFL